jgi:hypothetical protein
LASGRAKVSDLFLDRTFNLPSGQRELGAPETIPTTETHKVILSRLVKLAQATGESAGGR